MAEALTLARRALGRTSPNPLVGAVVVKDGRVVGRGFHPYPGAPHAEIFALQEAGSLADRATLYVTLEPCCHWGRTGPCTQAIVAAGIARVVVATEDPDPRVNGSGIAALRQAGIEVTVGVLREAAEALNAAYLKQRRTGLPFVTLKWAMSLDGKIAARRGSRTQLTGEEAQRYTADPAWAAHSHSRRRGELSGAHRVASGVHSPAARSGRRVATQRLVHTKRALQVHPRSARQLAQRGLVGLLALLL